MTQVINNDDNSVTITEKVSRFYYTSWRERVCDETGHTNTFQRTNILNDTKRHK